MRDTLIILSYVLQLFWMLLLARIVIEMIASFSRNFSPRGIMAVLFEWLFTITDPPVKLLRRLIPPVRLGGISLDLSVMVLFLLLYLGQVILASLISAV